MSEFIDKLKKISEAPSAPLGFRAARAAALKPGPLLVAGIMPDKAGSAADCAAGADAALLRISSLTSANKALVVVAEATPGVPWGAWLTGGSGKNAKQLAKLKADFLVFPAADTPLFELPEKTGRILAVDASLGDGLLSTLNELPVDAVLVSGESAGGDSLTWHHLMVFQRLARWLTKPLLAPVPAGVSGDELKCLWVAGVDGVVVAAAAGGLGKLRQVLDGTDFSPRHKRGGGGVRLAYTGEPASADDEEE